MQQLIARIAFWRPSLGEIEIQATEHVYQILRSLSPSSRERVLKHVREILGEEGGYLFME